MTEYELIDLVGTHASSAQISAQMLITLCSGYLVVAWFVGKQLSRAQVMTVNALFIFFHLGLCFSWQNKMQVVSTLSKELVAQNPLRDAAPFEYIIPLSEVGIFMALLACLGFMWNIRHPKTK